MSMPCAVGRLVELRPGDMGVHPEQVEAGRRGPGSRRRPVRSQLASASARRVGPQLRPLRKRRSPLTVATKLRTRTCRRPVVSDAVAGRSDSAVLRLDRRPRRSRTLDLTLEGLGAEGVRPPQLGTFDGQPPAHPVDPRGQGVFVDTLDLIVSAGMAPLTPGGGAHGHGARAQGVEVGLELQGGGVLGGVSAQHLEQTGCAPGPVSSIRTGAQIPPGFQSGSMQSQCWKTPVRLRLAPRSDGREHATSTASSVIRAGRAARR